MPRVVAPNRRGENLILCLFTTNRQLRRILVSFKPEQKFAMEFLKVFGQFFF
jgi:hypothetical protein